jgi:hypothetical protein
MAGTRITVSEALDEALDFARGAWRDAWVPVVLTGAGWALLVVAANAQLSDSAAATLRTAGILLLLFHIPLLGALYRSALGGRPYRGLGPGGLQIGGVEARLLVVNAVIGFFCILACAPMMLLSGLFYLGLRRFDGVSLGPLGHWEWWFLAAAVFWAAFILGLIYLLGRLATATPLSIERRRILPWDSWTLTPGHGRAIAMAFIVGHMPTLIVLVALKAFGWIETDAIPTGMHGPWPLPEAIGAGALTGVVLAGLQAPLSVGLIAVFYDVLSPPIDDESSDTETVPAEQMPGEEDHLPPEDAQENDHEPAADRLSEDKDPLDADPEALHEPEPAPEPELDPPFSAVAYSPYMGRFARLTVPWSADEPVPEQYEAFSTPEPHAAPEPEPDVYPHSVVEFSPHTGRFSRMFAPWLSHEDPPSEAVEPQSGVAAEVETHAEPAQETVEEDLVEAEPHPASVAEAEEPGHEIEAAVPHFASSAEAALDGAGEPEHRTP